MPKKRRTRTLKMRAAKHQPVKTADISTIVAVTTGQFPKTLNQSLILAVILVLIQVLLFFILL